MILLYSIDFSLGHSLKYGSDVEMDGACVQIAYLFAFEYNTEKRKSKTHVCYAKPRYDHQITNFI